ncbi:MAG: 50S ribosomal protein L3 [Candidatus Latescibacteria bacterium]|nr:50S ribosomal protein L3 [Candidatus Latescibacterota bacterium]NIM20826.1 50S ribosomal protein L3 [Candidatus Latescibacterota bacterium]NIM64392.1 50S ribosomal protein L3 [Candidatus Latescibacterota bacterium]NIO00543.1 50S ribosomal protein L3 [Candidatus Latescibacterota bacterium]NIO26946.1 50S ribosomal protein L3 [Candidatus Latescibacterota bacterium]
MELLIGKKLGMMQVFEDAGRVIPVSVLQVGPCPVVQVKTPERDGYAAVQLGFEEVKESRAVKPLRGHFKRAKVKPQRILKEVRVEDPENYKVGDAIDVKMFEGTNRVHVIGISKGRGFTGTTKRHGFRTGRMTHGNKSHRAPGSVGNCATPSRIFKGKRLPGRMGGVRTTMKNLEVVQIDAENNLLFVKGAVPGANNGVVFVRKA